MNNNKPKTAEATALKQAKDEFVLHWGAIGSAWGINRTMAQIHALLLITPQPLTTDEIMAELAISRGNAHGNLRDLCGWGLVKKLMRKGERKELFEAEKDIWKMFCIIVRERKRREIEPAITTLKDCSVKARNLKGSEAKAFHQQMSSLCEFVEMANRIMEKVSQAEQSYVIPLALKMFG